MKTSDDEEKIITPEKSGINVVVCRLRQTKKREQIVNCVLMQNQATDRPVTNRSLKSS